MTLMVDPAGDGFRADRFNRAAELNPVNFPHRALTVRNGMVYTPHHGAESAVDEQTWDMTRTSFPGDSRALQRRRPPRATARRLGRVVVASGFCFCWLTTLAAAAAEGLTIDRRLYEQRALTVAGDVGRGRQLFFDEPRTKCVTCHKLEGRGGEVGPDLSAVGGKFGRPHLIESLLEPSRQIVEGFRSSIVVLSDGRVLTGVVKEASPGSFLLVDGEGRRHILRTADVEQRTDSDVSLMPENLMNGLTAEEFTDLVAFLESCRSGGKRVPGSELSGGITLPSGFTVEIVATGLTGATALETTGDGRVFICEQTGALRVVKGGRLLAEPVLTLPVEADWERGLVGVTVDPAFPSAPFVYVCYVARRPAVHHRVSRFTLHGDMADPASELVLLEGDDQTRLGGKIPAGHQGGAVHFGPDGLLYVAIGDQTAGLPAQDLGTFQGKLLRIRADGSLPEDNPFLAQAEGKYRAIWALGLRNPYTFAIRRPDGVMCINDVGGDRFEEVNRGMAGGNYGWPLSEGPTDDSRFVTPLYAYPRASICGGDFAPAGAPWPQPYRRRYFFGDFVHGWIKTLDVEHPEQVETFAAGVRHLVDLRFSPDGGLYVLSRNAWVIDDKFSPRTGSLLRIRPIEAGAAVQSHD